MPRAPRGPRPAPNANRSDLLNPPAQPISTVPGQPYGQAQNEQEAQRIAPMSGGGAPTPPGPGGPPTPQAAPPSDPQTIMAAMAAHAAAGGGPHPQGFLRPTERPNEPVTHGLPTGPGAGPEALMGIGAAARDNAIEGGTLQNLLQSMAAQPTASSAIQYLAGRAAGGTL